MELIQLLIKIQFSKSGKTIAVIGSGFNNIYPEENIELFNQIIENGGLIISEYEPNKEINLSNFPTRNRIISALSECVIVTEAKARSGSSTTARHAKEQNKKVFCLPGKISDINSKGTNELIKKGANIITSINDIFEEIGEDFVENEVESIKIKDEYKKIYNLIKECPLNINELSRKSNIGISELNIKITMMELEGLVEVKAGNIVKIKE